MIDDPCFQALLVVHIGQQQQLVGGWLGRMSSLTYLLVKDLRRLFLVKQFLSTDEHLTSRVCANIKTS